MPWEEVAGNSGVFVHEYDAAGFGRTNSLAIKLAEGLVVLSPASGMDDASFAELDRIGKLYAIVSPHAGHTLGIRSWNARYPQVPVFAAPGSIPRIAQMTGVAIKPIGELRTASPEVSFIVPAGTERMTVLVDVRRGERRVVYADETLIDLDRPPSAWLARIFYFLGRSGPGLRLNRTYLRMFVHDKEALRDDILKLLEGKPFVIFAHGPVRSSDADLAAVHALLRKM